MLNEIFSVIFKHRVSEVFGAWGKKSVEQCVKLTNDPEILLFFLTDRRGGIARQAWLFNHLPDFGRQRW